MSMFKRKSTPPTISPLAPPPPSQDRRSSFQPPQQRMGSPQGLAPQQGLAPGPGPGPGYHSGTSVNRQGSYDSSTIKSEKSEKRRSGFFGFGKKDKDKERDRGDSEIPARSSFSVERSPANHQPDSSAIAQYRPTPNSGSGSSQGQGQGQTTPFQPYQMHQFPPPQPGRTPPAPIDGPTSPTLGQGQGRPMSSLNPNQGQGHGQRVASASNPQTAANDFRPYPSAGSMPRSQTMGFQGGSGRGGGGLPEGQAYRGNPNAPEQGQDGQRGPQMPRSGSMPLDKVLPPGPGSMTNGTERQGSPNANPRLATSTSNSNIGGRQSGPPPPQAGSPSANSGSPSNMPTPQMVQQPPTPSSQAQAQGPQANQPNWQREFNIIVDLIGAQPNKHYVASPPELEMILARTSAGALPKQGQPGSATNDWDAVWLQLSGISLSMWSMKETRAAAAKGEKVPPTYFNITDSSLELLAPLPPPPHRPNSHPHQFVYSLNTAGSNRLLFSCPSDRDLARWTTGLRLAAWERARLEEIYTGHLIKTGGREPKCELVKGRMEGWVRVRVMGGTDWKRLWLVLASPHAEEVSKEDEKKSRRRSIFGFGDKEKPEPVQEPNTGVSMASFYNEPRTPKNRTTPAVLTITNITQSYAVFPERLEVMSQSNLMKVVGRVNGELVTIEGRLRESGWALIMPEAPGEGTASPPPSTPLANMMRWVTAFHDVFGLYGRPERYIWDRTNPKSFFFAYPEGPNRDSLFLDTDEALVADFRTASLPAVRANFVEIAKRKLHEPLPAAEYRDEKASSSSRTTPSPRPDGDYRLPPLAFDRPSPNHSSESQPRSLTPITERTDDASRQNSTRTANSGPYEQRRASENSKQGSGSSARNPSGGEEPRLEPITDEGHMTGPWTEEPQTQTQTQTQAQNRSMMSNDTVTSPEDTMPGSIAPSRGLGTQETLDSRTGETMWSQSSAHSQSGASTPTTNHAHPSQLPPIVTSSGRPMELERPDGAGGGYRRKDDLPDLPTPSAPAVPAVPVAGAAMLPVAGAAPRTEVRSVTPQQLRQAEQQHEQELREHNVHAPTPRKVSSREVVLPSTAEAGLESEPAAVYLMNMVDEPQHHVEPVSAQTTSASAREGLQPSPAAGRVRSPSDGAGGNLTSIGRKPSGARAPPPKKQSTGPSRALSAVDETGQPIASPPISAVGQSQSQLQPQDQGQHAKIPSSTSHHDLGEDVSAFVAYADAPSPDKGKSKALAPPAKEETVEGPRSSFALSKSAADRRARAEAAAAEQERAKYIPGAGKRTAPRAEQWHGNESDSEDESDEDEVDDSPEVKPRAALPEPPLSASHGGREGDATVERSTSQARALPSIPRPGANGAERDYSMPSELDPPTRYRPASRSPGPRQEQYRDQGRERDQYADNRQSMAPPRSQYDTQRQSQINPPASLQQQQNPNRQTVWNANFAADHGMQENKSGKFVEMDDPATHLTKAFAPHGLLQAGLQDKEDRSAKRQEELARETGTSLISVPSKPPPPQTGLLGAVAAHERERKNAGGIGATLTDREREKRLNEDRQREMDRSRQGQGQDPMRPYSGDPYGGQQQYPYGMPPMMMGMPQMQMPYGGYQGGYNPYAQQQAMMAAQMAYQQAMMMAQQQHPPSHHGGGGGGSQAGGHTPERSSSPPTVPGPPGAGYGYPSPHLGLYGWPGMMPPPAWGGGSPGLGVPGPGTPGQGWYPPQPPYQQQQQDGGSMRSGRASMYSDDGRGRSSDREKEGGREREPAN